MSSFKKFNFQQEFTTTIRELSVQQPFNEMHKI